MIGTVEEFWKRFRASSEASDCAEDPYEAEPFGDSPELANQLGRLIVEGVKTATCSALWEWEAEGQPIPQVGERLIVLDGRDVPLCIIETTEVTIRPFSDVDETLAHDEGEGDRTLDSWRLLHWDYFSRVLPRIGREPSEDMPLVCERFQMIYKD